MTSTRRVISLNDYFRMVSRSEALMGEYRDYAQSIGCPVIQDSIEANEEQSKLLAEWWKTKANAGPASSSKT